MIGRLQARRDRAGDCGLSRNLSARARRAPRRCPFIGKRPIAGRCSKTWWAIRRPLYVLLAATLMPAADRLPQRGQSAGGARGGAAARNGDSHGAGRRRLRLLREQLTESLLLSAAGGALGLLLAGPRSRWLVHTRQDMTRVDAIHIDGVVVAFTVGVIVLCALFAGAGLGFDGVRRQARACRAAGIVALASAGQRPRARCARRCWRWRWASRWCCWWARGCC